MSYSFQVKAATKAEAKTAVEAEWDKIVQHQPEHTQDQAAAIAAAHGMIDALGHDDDKDIVVSCNGYVSWISGTASPTTFVGAAVTCNASLANREQ